MNDREEIYKISKQDNKKTEEEFLRNLWREIFGDSAEYEDFYFENVYRQNKVYEIPEKGMLHLNPYCVMVQGKEMILHYIVGVATKKTARRQGIMRKLLEKAFEDMYEEKEPFTYLMPANVKYYHPFDFVSISAKQENILNIKPKNKSEALPGNTSRYFEKHGAEVENIQFVGYDEFLEAYEMKQQQEILHSVNQMLSKKYHIFAKHDKAYFDLLWREKRCQGGDVVFCLNAKEKEIMGFFAYEMNGKKMCVEQYVLEDEVITLYGNCKKAVPVLYHFPFMVRIIHVEVFLSLFAKSFSEFAVKGKRLYVTDSILTENNGIYRFQFVENQVVVKKQQKSGYVAKIEWDEAMTVEELTKFIFCGEHAKENRVFFAEVV